MKAAADQEMEYKDDAKKILVFDFLGYSVFVGCNAQANDQLVNDHKKNHPKCLWMHVVGRKGAHIVLCRGDKDGEIQPIVMRYAAGRTLKFSGIEKGRVTYAPLEDVYKPDQASHGIFRTWRTTEIEL